jgi:hypothetical protein
MRIALITIGSIIGLFVLIFAANEFEIFGTRFWGVRKANAQREVFENTQSYVEGKRQELIKLHHEWSKASADDKIAIEATIRMNFANFDESKIEQPELYSFLKTIKYK